MDGLRKCQFDSSFYGNLSNDDEEMELVKLKDLVNDLGHYSVLILFYPNIKSFACEVQHEHPSDSLQEDTSHGRYTNM